MPALAPFVRVAGAAGAPMKTHPDIIDILNECLTAELTGVNQYFVHAKMCQNWG